MIEEPSKRLVADVLRRTFNRGEVERKLAANYEEADRRCTENAGQATQLWSAYNPDAFDRQIDTTVQPSESRALRMQLRMIRLIREQTRRMTLDALRGLPFIVPQQQKIGLPDIRLHEITVQVDSVHEAMRIIGAINLAIRLLVDALLDDAITKMMEEGVTPTKDEIYAAAELLYKQIGSDEESDS